MKDTWINALGKMTYGLYVLTTTHKDQINGMIASWVTQVSYDPLLIQVAVHPNRYSHHLIEQSGCFALHAITVEQSDYLDRFKGSDSQSKFSSIPWKKGQTGCPIIEDCIAFFELKLVKKYKPGNHTLFIGEVIDAGINTEKRPLTSIEYEGIYLGKS
jgi:flavin reductase (DIM6/NTAB) family NADH-FMN oxidoreductase RutF